MKEQVKSVQIQRCSNLELYRIICMLMIVAHHYVVNSGLGNIGGLLDSTPDTPSAFIMRFFGAWGKTGINCFLMITGYFMCTSQITVRKFLKLFLQILFYNIIIYAVFYIFGYESLSLKSIIPVLIPFWGFSDGFVSCFIAFYLTIPFWNILIRNMSSKEHLLLLALLLTCYTILGSIPFFEVTFNYITWFGIIYLTASYIRLYPNNIFEKKRFWGWMSIIIFILGGASIWILIKLNMRPYMFISDCNKVIAVAFAVCSFLWFKNINIKHSKMINSFGAGTFGVLLIHANSKAMRTWLWKDTIDVVGHYAMPIGSFLLYSIGVVLLVFIVCNLIDQLRIATLEKWFLKFYDNKVAAKINLLKKIIK